MRLGRAALIAAVGLSLTAGWTASAGPTTGSAARPGGAGQLERAAAPGRWAMSQSANWSGYGLSALASGTTFHQVSGTWVVPRARPRHAGQAEFSATWVGIGGGCLALGCLVNDNTLIQAGTEQDVAANGTTDYYAWWEVIPVPQLTAAIAVRPGDVVSVSIAQTLPEWWTISIDDRTRHTGWSTAVPYTSTYDTAEWVVETPISTGTGGTGIQPIPVLSTVHFDNGFVNGAAVRLSGADAIQLSNGGVVVTPSAPDRDRDGFNDCTYTTRCPVPLDLGQRPPRRG